MTEARAAIPRKRRKFSKPPGMRQTESFKRAQKDEVARPIPWTEVIENRWLKLKRDARNSEIAHMGRTYIEKWEELMDVLGGRD